MNASQVIRRWQRDLSLLLAILFLLLASPAFRSASAQDARDADRAGADEDDVFLRIRRTDSGEPVALETSIVRYVPADGSDGMTVDLVGAVHIADRQYYRQLNEAFTEYDALLYELVAPENMRPVSGQRAQHPVTGIQRTLKNMLELEFQLDQVDYSPKNFVHADMSPAEFAESMKDRGESFLQMYFRMLGYAMATQSSNPGSDASLLLALFSQNRAVRLKRIMADQFEDLDGALSAFNGPDGSTLISERNKKALSVLREQMDKGKRRIGIFYGAGHFADMEQRLVDDFGLRRAEVKWLTAWDLGER